MRGSRSSWLVVMLLGLAACGNPTPPTGSLSVAVTGLPVGAAAAVQISGPDGYIEAVTATRVLTGLAPGAYAVTAATVDDGHPIVPATYDPTVATPSVDVIANGTTVAAVTHAWRAPTGRLWLSRSQAVDAALVGYDAAQLVEDGAPQPAVAIGFEATTWAGIAFDAAGNAWVAQYAPDTAVVRFRSSDLAASAARVPDVILTSADIAAWNGPGGLAFDDSGALWVSGYTSNTIVKFAPEQLGASGSPTPQVVVRASAGSLNLPAGLAFDAAGRLWAANAGNASIVMFTPQQLAASGSPTPAVTITSTTGHLTGAFGLAFDPDGHLWVAPFSRPSVVRYDAGQLLATGSPTPSATITGFLVPKGLAFDHGGDLWVHAILAGGSFLVRIADPTSLTMESAAVFATAIEVTVATDGGFPTFFPPPPGVPIRTP